MDAAEPINYNKSNMSINKNVEDLSNLFNMFHSHLFVCVVLHIVGNTWQHISICRIYIGEFKFFFNYYYFTQLLKLNIDNKNIEKNIIIENVAAFL